MLDGTDLSRVGKLVTKFSNYGKKNQESVGELFVTLLIKLASVETLWPKGLCTSVHEGSWILKTWDSKYDTIRVEDFTDRSQNVARAVGTNEVKKIYQCIHHSLHYVCSFMNGKLQAMKLREILFGRESILALVDNLTPNVEQGTLERCITIDPVQTKRMRSAGSWEGTMQAIPFTAVLKKAALSSPEVTGGGKPTESWPSVNSSAIRGGK